MKRYRRHTQSLPAWHLLGWQLDDQTAGTLHYEQAAMLFMQPSIPQALTFYLHCRGPHDCAAAEHTKAV